MRQYNVEIFDRSYTFRDAKQIGSFDYSFDYLSIEENTIPLPTDTKCEVGDYLFLTSETDYMAGIVSSVKNNKKILRVNIKPFMSWLDVEIKKEELTGYIEEYLKGIIDGLYVNNSDTYQNIIPLTTQTTSQTLGTIVLENETMKLFDVICELFKKYGVVIRFEVDSVAGQIKCLIGKNTEPQKTIEADLPNLISKNIVMKTSSMESFNKVYIFNTGEDSTGEEVTYYRDADGTITETPSERILPVVFKDVSIQAKPEDFDTKALEKAADVLAVEKNNNLIELEMLEDDSLFEPKEMNIGQDVLVISEGKEYESMLTGYKFKNGKITLIFGAIRLELTKILKRRLSE